jgi:hypothetical protein
MPLSREQRQELLRAHVAPPAGLVVVMLVLAWISPVDVAVWKVGLIGIIVVVICAVNLATIGAVKDLLDNKVYRQTATLTAKDIAMPLEMSGSSGAEPIISGYYGIFEGIGKLKIGYTAFEESAIGAAYRVGFSRASQRAWSVEPAE